MNSFTNNTYEESRKESDKIKKLIIIILLLFMSSTKFAYATEYPEITEDIEIKYKWYKEVQKGDYYPLKDISYKEKVDKTKIILGDYSEWKATYCNLSTAYYEISTRTRYKYKKAESVRYILIEGFEYNDNITIYYENKPINYKVMNKENKQIKIDLNNLYLSETLLFYITNAENYKIGLYKYDNFEKEVISKQIKNENLIIPDKSWITENSSIVEEITGEVYKNSDLTNRIKTYSECRYREKYVYKYETQREYYDNNYYLNVEGYIKDTEDYKVYYKGEPITNIIEITKETIVKEPQIEYIYIEKEKEIQTEKVEPSKETKENDSSKEINCKPEIKTKVEIQKVFKIPKIVYIVVLTLIIIIIFLIIKLYKKYVV